MRGNKKLTSGMQKLRLEVVDYCFVILPKYSLEEVLVWYTPNYFVTREDMLTLQQLQLIANRVPDCYFMMLNEFEYLLDDKLPRFFFGLSYMEVMKKIMEKGENSSAVDVIIESWGMWKIDQLHSAELHDVVLRKYMSMYLEKIGHDQGSKSGRVVVYELADGTKTDEEIQPLKVGIQRCAILKRDMLLYTHIVEGHTDFFKKHKDKTDVANPKFQAVLEKIDDHRSQTRLLADEFRCTED